jgi:hypothetical protein
MGVIWVHVEPDVVAEGPAMGLLTESGKETIRQAAVDQVVRALPKGFTTETKLKPKKAQGNAPNAIKLAVTVVLGIETKGSSMTVDFDFRMVVQAIQSPKLDSGKLMSSGNSGIKITNRGSAERHVIGFAETGLQHVVPKFVPKVLTQDTLKAYGRRLGLPM